MRHLILPTATEELVVRGRYAWRSAGAAAGATEQWERYRNAGSDVVTLRAQWQNGANTLRSHVVQTAQGIERVRLRWHGASDSPRNLTLTRLETSWLLNLDGEHVEVGAETHTLLLPIAATVAATFDFPLDVGRIEQRDVVVVRPPSTVGSEWHVRRVATRFEPLADRETEWRGTALRLKGWQWSAWDEPTQAAWFDRNATCLAWQCQTGLQPWVASLNHWMSFG